MTNGKFNNEQGYNILTQLEVQSYWSKQNIEVGDCRNNRIPTLNASGISMTIAFSRVLLLAQYVTGKEYENINKT